MFQFKDKLYLYCIGKIQIIFYIEGKQNFKRGAQAMKKLYSIAIVVITLAFMAAFLTGCSARPKDSSQPGGKPGTGVQTPAKKPGDYFPLTKGSSWQYLGEGNEYASFNRLVLFTKENRSQMKWDNGGTVGAAVFETTDSAVTRIFMQGEGYDETNFLDVPPSEHIIILKAPLEVGNRWENQKGDIREIVDTSATITTPAGTFENCIKIKISYPGSTIYEYYKDGAGMVKSEFISGDTRVTSTLEKYNIQ